MFACAFTGAVWAQPTITSFSPSSGPVGTSVTISGGGFDDVVPSNNIVYFGAVRALVTSVPSTSQLVVTVPLGSTFAPLVVSNGGLSAYSKKSFVVTFGSLPVIDATMLAGKVDFSVSPSTGPRAVALGDIDGDGKPDLVVANSGSGEIRILRNTAVAGGLNSGSFSTPGNSYPAGSTPAGLALGDLDSDGDLDVVVSDSSGGKIYIWRNGSSPGNIDSTSMTSITVGTTPFGIAINDLDIDGRPDIVVANKGSNNISILENNGSLAFAKTDYGTGSGPVDVIAQSDLDGDDLPDVVSVNNGSASVFLNTSFLGLLGMFSPVSVPLGTGSCAIVSFDLNADNLDDIIASNQSGNSVSLVRNTSTLGTIQFAAKVDIGAGTNPFRIGLADFEGDGKPDVVLANRSVDSISIMRNAAVAGSFTSTSLAAPVRFAVGSSPSGLALGDIDGDGKTDIVTANAGSADLSVLRNKAVRVIAEAGNDSTSAVPMSIGETVQSVLTSGSDVDYYRFVLSPGDTVSLETSAANGGNLTVGFEVFDTVGNYYKGRWERLDDTHSWYVFAPILSQAKTFLVRVISAYNNTYFPNSSPEGGMPKPQMVVGSAAAVDSGFYYFAIDRFVPSAPRVYYYSGVYSASYNRARWWVDFYPNGLSTTVSIEYSTSSDLSGSTIVPAGQSPGSGITRLYFDSPLTGLTPNTRYYFKATAENSLGSVQTQINQFETPPAPVGWVHQFVGSGNTITGIAYGDDTTGIAVGYGNLRRRTTNGGTTWGTFPDSVDGQNLYGVHMVSALLGFAVGSSETIARTTNGGANWSKLTNTGTGYDLWRVKFVTSAIGMAVGSGGLIIKTTNTGQNWTVSRPTGGYDLRGVDYAGNVNTVVAVGFNGTILRSTNGGTTWDSIPKNPAWPDYLLGIDFVSSTTGFIVTNGAVLKTTDAGLTWTIVNIPNIDIPWLYDISFKDANNGIMVGDNGTILRTSDGGVSWKKEVTGTYASFQASTYRGRSLAAGSDNGLVLSSLDPKGESEPNETWDAATPIAYRDEVDARIDQADIDFYKFTALAADTIVAFVENRDTAGVNGLLELYDVDGTILLESNDDFVPGDSVRSRIVRILPAPGTYYIRYAGASSSSSGNYRISLNKAGLKPIVPFGGLATIVSTTEAILKSPVISNNLATDILFEYGLTTVYGDTISADQSGSSGQQLVNATKVITGLVDFQTYHFRVKATNSAGTTYGPDVTFLTALGMLRAEAESNNTSSTGNTIYVGDTVHAAIATDTDVDYYRFQAAAGDTLEIFLTQRSASGLDSKIEVFDSTSGNQLFGYANDFIPDSKNLHVAFVAVNTGVYHIRQSWQSNWNSYYPNQAAPTPEPVFAGPQAVATSTTSSSGDYELRLKRFAPSAPDVRKNPWAEGISSSRAYIHTDVTSNGSPTDVYIEYGTSSSLGSIVQYAGGPVVALGYQFWFRVPINGLTPGTLYYFRIKAVNAIDTSFSDIATFTTAQPSEKWSQKTVPEGEFSGVSAINDSVAIVLDAPRMLRTTNAGATWVSQNLPQYPYSVSFKDADTAFALGYSVIRSNDKGATWQTQQNYPVNTYSYATRFLDSQVGAAAGQQYNQATSQWGGHVVRTIDGGTTWETVGFFSYYMLDVDFVSVDTVRAVSYNGWLYRTNNFSATTPSWDSVQVEANYSTRGVRFIDADTGIVVGSRIWRTTNGGSSWLQVITPNDWMLAVEMKNSRAGVAVGGSGLIYRTTDFGASWTQEPSGVTTSLRSVEYVGRTAIAVGEIGTILYSIDPLNETEPNNAAGTANTFGIGEQVDGSIESSGDLDFYSFAAVADDTLEVLLTGVGGNPVNGGLQIIGTDSSAVLAQNDDFVVGDTSIARLVYVITAPGTYYIRAAGSNSGSVGTYLLELSRTSLKPNVVSTSVSVTPTTATITTVVDPNSLQTTVRLDYGLTTSYGTSIQFIGSPIAPTQQRQSLNRTLTGLADNSDFNFRIVAVNNVDSVLSQNMTFHTPRATALAEAEPNDSAHLAQEIVLGDSVNGSILPLNDVDYYKVHVVAGDTVEFFATRRGTSEFYGRIQVYDSAGQYTYEDQSYFPRSDSLHSIISFGDPRTLYIRYLYSSNYNTSFPGAVNDEEILPTPQILPLSAVQTASQDTGEYRLFVRRFIPSAPEGYSYVGYNSLFSDAMQLNSTIQANGLPTDVNFEYGPTQSYGTQVSALNGPFTGYWRQGANSSLITGLQPNTTYYVRTFLTNSAGSSYGGGNTITTPPAPEGWTRQISGTDYFLRGIAFPSESIGFVVGSGSTIRKTIDGGVNWATLTPATGGTFYSVSFVSTSVGMISGSSGTIQKTINGGTTWSQVGAVGQSMMGIRMLNANEAIAVGNVGMIVRTTNGGTSWDTVRTGTEYLRSVAFSPDGNTGYAVGYTSNSLPFFTKTTNRGASWQDGMFTGSYLLMFVWCLDGQTAIAGGGNHTFYRTSDGGTTWTESTPPQGNGYYVYGMAFVDTSAGVAVDNSGSIYRTYDGGRNWAFHNSGTSNLLYGVAMQGRSAYVTGIVGTILKSVGLLAKPANLVASFVSSDSVTVTWGDINGETGYFVERKTTAGGSYSRIRTLGVNTASTVDTATPGHVYYYRVQAFDAVDTTLYSSEDSVLVPLRRPTNLFAAALGKTKVQLTWQTGGIDARVGYIIERHTGGSWGVIDTVGNVTTYIDSTASSGTFYTYQVKSYNAEMSSGYAAEANTTTPGLVTAPSNLTATYQGPNFVNISWSDNASNETGYWIEKKIGAAGSYTLWRDVGADSTSTADTIQRGRIYYYRVRGYSAADTSSYAAEDSALAPLYAPSNLVASTVSSSSIGLSWQNSSDARTGYKVERKAGSGGSYTEITTLGDVSSYSDNTPASGTQYYYRLRSYTSELNSEYSNVDSALTALGKPQSIAANPSSVTNGSVTISWSGPSGATNAWYSIDAPPSSGLSTQMPLVANSFVLSSPPTGARWVFVALENTEGFTDYTAYDSVLTQFDNVDPVITDQSVLPTIEITGTNVSTPTSVTLQAQIVKPSGIASLLLPQLEYKKTNSATIIIVPFQNLEGGSLNLGNLNSLFLTIGKPNGLEYRITASDVAGNTAATVWKSFTVFVNTPPVSDFVPPAAGTTDDITALVTNYRLFSVPYDLSDKKPGAYMEKTIDGLGPHAEEGVNYYHWRMQRYFNANYQDYEDFKSLDVLTPGTAFFLLSRVQKTITFGSGNLVKASDMYNNGIQVIAGWNLIGNPFPDDFPADSLFVLAGSIANKAYYDGTGPDGGWYKTAPQINTLKKWEGLAINVTQNTTLRFKAVPQTSEEELPPIPMAMSAEKVIGEKKEGGWLMKIDAHRSGTPVVDVGNMIGEAPNAEEGYDPFDSFQPPLIPGKSLALYFKNQDGAMSSDIRPIQTNGSSWEMKVMTGDRGARVKIGVSDVVALPDLALEAYMLDIDDHMAYDLRERRNVEFGSKEGTRNFRIVVGSKGYVDSVSASLGIDLVPQVFMLYQNYPNPFNPETALRFWLPSVASVYKVTLKVYNIIGQEVSTLIDRDMKAGYYETTFSGRNMASGTYIYRLTVDGGTKETSFSSVKKMVMVK